MPCYDSRDDHDAAEAQARANKVTALLCGVMGLLDTVLLSEEEMATLFQEVPNLNAWWVEHKRIDAERKRQEERAKKARRIEREVALFRKKLERE